MDQQWKTVNFGSLRPLLILLGVAGLLGLLVALATITLRVPPGGDVRIKNITVEDDGWQTIVLEIPSEATNGLPPQWEPPNKCYSGNAKMGRLQFHKSIVEDGVDGFFFKSSTGEKHILRFVTEAEQEFALLGEQRYLNYFVRKIPKAEFMSYLESSAQMNATLVIGSLLFQTASLAFPNIPIEELSSWEDVTRYMGWDGACSNS